MDTPHLLDVHHFTHELCRVESGDGSVCFFTSFHSDESEPARVASVRVVHDGCLFDLCSTRRYQRSGDTRGY